MGQTCESQVQVRGQTAAGVPPAGGLTANGPPSSTLFIKVSEHRSYSGETDATQVSVCDNIAILLCNSIVPLDI